MNKKSLAEMWKRYWLSQIKLMKTFGIGPRSAMICQMNMVCYEAQEWAGAKR